MIQCCASEGYLQHTPPQNRAGRSSTSENCSARLHNYVQPVNKRITISFCVGAKLVETCPCKLVETRLVWVASSLALVNSLGLPDNLDTCRQYVTWGCDDLVWLLPADG